jgi:hypothetical protein
MRGVCENVILLARKIDIEQLVSFRGRGGSVFRPQLESFPRCIFQMSRQRGARNAEQFCCAALVTIGLIVNEAYVPLDGSGERKIDMVMSLMLIVRPRGPGAGRLPMPWRLRLFGGFLLFSSLSWRRAGGSYQ